MTVFNYKMKVMKDFVDLINEIGNKRGYKKIVITQEKYFLEVDIEFDTDPTGRELFDEQIKMDNKNIMFGSENTRCRINLDAVEAVHS